MATRPRCCNLYHYVDVGQRAPQSVWLNIQTPYMPRTTDGKAPDLKPFVDLLAEATRKAARGARRAAPAGAPARRRTIKEITLAALPEAIAFAGSEGRYLFSQRQLFYAIRPHIARETGKEPLFDTFTAILTDYEEHHRHRLRGRGSRSGAQRCGDRTATE